MGKYITAAALFFLLTSIPAEAQFLEPYASMNYDFSNNIINYFPTGSLGFGDNLNPYNPQIIDSESRFIIHAGGVSNISQEYQPDNFSLTQKISLFPNFIFQFQAGKFAFQAAYITSMASSMEYSGEPVALAFTYFYHIYTDYLSHEASTTVLKFSAILLAHEKLSITAGALTNNFQSQFTLPDISFRFYRSFFNNYQLFFSLNSTISKAFKAYLLFKSEDSGHKTFAETSKPNFASGNPKVFFNGNLGTGIQYSPVNKLKISLETKHDFFTYKKISYDYLPPYTTSKDIFNSNIIIGASFNPLDMLEIGILGSKYIEYRNPLFAHQENRETLTTPLGFNFGAKYKYSRFHFNFMYQYGHSEFNDLVKETAHYLGIGAGAEF